MITGAGRGLGLGLAHHFAPTDRVIGTARRPDAAPDLAALAEQTLALDVASDDSIAALAAGAEQIGPIDILINNAGINALAVRGQPGGAGGRGRGVLDTDRADFLGQVDVNAAGPLLVTQALLPQLEAGGGALVVNISSQLGSMEVGAQMGQDLGYNASKAALNMVTVRAAAELGDRGGGGGGHPSGLGQDRHGRIGRRPHGRGVGGGRGSHDRVAVDGRQRSVPTLGRDPPPLVGQAARRRVGRAVTAGLQPLQGTGPKWVTCSVQSFPSW